MVVPVPAPFSMFYPQFPGLNMNYMIPVAPSEPSASPDSAPPSSTPPTPPTGTGTTTAGYPQAMMQFYPYGEGIGAVPMMMTSEGVLVPATGQPIEGAAAFATMGFGREEGPPRRESEGGERA